MIILLKLVIVALTVINVSLLVSTVKLGIRVKNDRQLTGPHRGRALMTFMSAVVLICAAEFYVQMKGPSLRSALFYTHITFAFSYAGLLCGQLMLNGLAFARAHRILGYACASCCAVSSPTGLILLSH